ncbi:superoxide dismutase [Ixodes scapularis]
MPASMMRSYEIPRELLIKDYELQSPLMHTQEARAVCRSLPCRRWRLRTPRSRWAGEAAERRRRVRAADYGDRSDAVVHALRRRRRKVGTARRHRRSAFLLPCATAIERRAVCYSPGNVSMMLFFVQENIEHAVVINGEIVGLTPGDHGLHVHSLGDLTNGCNSTGTHFNPMHKDHGAREDRERHVGDLGNINADVTGKARVYISDGMISLIGHHNIIGRALVNIEHAVVINGEIVGLTPGDHGLHVHSLGDLTKGCNSTGTHFNPMHKDHGAREDRERHVGDLGNINADVTGKARVYISDGMISLIGHHNIIGRALVVHALPDDLGRGGTDESKATGSSGARLACCVIGFQSGTGWPSPNSRLLFLMFSALLVFFCRHGA